MARCLVGCGSNLGGRREQVDRAIELLRFMPGISLEAVSRFRETRAVGGPAGQAAYLNGACLIETDLDPHQLLDVLAAVEQTLLRQRDERWGPRTIDLDLLLYDELVLDGVELAVPHPRMTTRRFVLEPCVEIAADFVHPEAGCTLRELLDNITVPFPLVAVVGTPASGAAAIAAAVADATLARPLPAPRPTPQHGHLTEWHETAVAWADALAGRGHHDEAQATVADFWLEGLPLAAVGRIADESLAGFEADVSRLAAATPVPNVVILLVSDADTLEERLAASERTAGATTVCTPPAAEVAAELEVQRRLVRRLRCPGERSSRTPRAIVRVDVRDPDRAIAEATAAVEAML